MCVLGVRLERLLIQCFGAVEIPPLIPEKNRVVAEVVCVRGIRLNRPLIEVIRRVKITTIIG